MAVNERWQGVLNRPPPPEGVFGKACNYMSTVCLRTATGAGWVNCHSPQMP